MTADDITTLLSEIRELKLEIKESNTRFNNHIDFVESIFNAIRVPFFRLMSLVSNEPPPLIEIDDNLLESE